MVVGALRAFGVRGRRPLSERTERSRDALIVATSSVPLRRGRVAGRDGDRLLAAPWRARRRLPSSRRLRSRSRRSHGTNRWRSNRRDRALEGANGVPGLDDPISRCWICRRSSCSFKPGNRSPEARQVVSERVATVTPTLPNWASPPVMLQPLSSTSRVMKVGLTPTACPHGPVGARVWNIRARPCRARRGECRPGANACRSATSRSTRSSRRRTTSR